MTNRRTLLAAAAALAVLPVASHAAEGDIFSGILQGIRDRKEREWFEKNRDEGLGTGSTTTTVKTASATRATSGKRSCAGATTKKKPVATGASSAVASRGMTLVVTIGAMIAVKTGVMTAVTTDGTIGATTNVTKDAIAGTTGAMIGAIAGMIAATDVR